MSFYLSHDVRNNRSLQIRNAIDAGPGQGLLKLYTGPQPARGAAITTQTFLGQVSFADPCGECAVGVFTAAPLIDGMALNTGTVAWARITDSNGIFVADASVTLLAGVGPVRMPSLEVYQGGNIHGVSVVITEGN